ncbi:MAG: SpoIIE family protein phosphatase [Bacteroidetes bacterium]|nr:SpoIIE family protein phosphatase [Bacteroidota bacterium]
MQKDQSEKKILNEIKSLENKIAELEKANDKLQKAYDKSRLRSIEIFGKQVDARKAKNFYEFESELLRQGNQALEEKNLKLEKANNKARRRTIDLFGKHIDLKKAKKQIELQNTELEKKNCQINDSLNYAKLIQEATLPTKDYIKSILPNAFIFFQPRDVVSGDFYWFEKIDNLIFVAAVDCTGHGVPGAFMSMIGTTLLNEIVVESRTFDTSQILTKLNLGVIHSLNQKSDSNLIRNDGMDITICCINKKNHTVDISCAGQTCYVINDEKLSAIRGDIFFEGDIFPNRPKLKYTRHSIKIKKDTTIYMFSDGYQDQFGGEKSEKYLSKNLKKLLWENHKLEPKKQNEIINNEFNTWKKNHQQIDDVLVIGININY